VTSANVACGFHAGDPSIMRRVTAAAVERDVIIGAQVAYRDLAGFGRRAIDVAPDVLFDEVLYQYGALAAMAAVAGGRVAYVKPHGALYNRIVHDEIQAGAVAAAVAAIDPGGPVLTLPGSVFAACATAAGLRPVREAYPDRAYEPDGTLVARSSPGALVTDPAEIAGRAVRMVVEGVVAAVDGTLVPVAVESLCLHGDSPGATAAALAVRAALEDAGVALRSFTLSPSTLSPTTPRPSSS
jgi:UPF0271 protein